MTGFDAHLLTSKLYMPTPSKEYVTRPRLLALLDEGVQHKITYVIAPAGYGKSTLISAWAKQQQGKAIGWLSLDEGDNDPVRFWEYVTAAVDCCRPGFAGRVRAALASMPSEGFEPFLIRFMNELRGDKGGLCLILDDFHLIREPSVMEAFFYLIDYLPADVHLIAAARTGAALSKARFFSRGWAMRLDETQLRFNLGDTEEFLHRSGVRGLTGAQKEQMLRMTEGWITGLKLLLLSQGGEGQSFDPAKINALPANGKLMEQYLFEEVFQSLSAELKSFLMECSSLNRFSEPLCRAVTGREDAGRCIESLEYANLFLIPLDHGREWWRLHHLFGDFLRARLEKERQGRVSELRRAAATWCESQGLEEEAVDYYLAGSCYEEAVRLLAKMNTFMIRREFSTLRGWLSVIPEALLWENRSLYLSYILALLMDNKPDQANMLLRQADERLSDPLSVWKEGEKESLLGNLHFLRSIKATKYEMDVVDGLGHIMHSMRYIPEGSELLYASPQPQLAPTAFRNYNGKRGKHLPREVAEPLFRGMIEFFTPMNIQAQARICYAEYLYERDELEESEMELRLTLTENIGNPFQPEKIYLPVYLFLSRLYRARQDPEEALRWLEEAAAEAVARKASDDIWLYLDAEHAVIEMEHGRLQAAVEWREKYGLTSEDPVSVYLLFPYILLLRVLIAEENYDEAYRLSLKLLKVSEKGHRPMDALEVQILQAMMHRKTGKTEHALLTLEEALGYAEPDGYIRVFLDKGLDVASLLNEYVKYRKRGHMGDRSLPALAFVRRVLLGFGDPSISVPSSGEVSLEALLTEKEYLIYARMAEGLNNKEIAAELGIGMGTLKSHINHIYGKLQAGSRVEALRRGKELEGL
ncbi:helix-turn-helix transcriptional regulator [Paenibacillus sp. 1011MAR3C5]|uniref:LuxR C-terminal-related transcriptional regulator n=1 Tax=Paenibacillus sp. 1011MAR3C5 TaxID=1675787 RepID=UPI000E6D2D12|nr:LuxR C-terminal-related transcriptional regulator [Paenibacillus sp. 1011MAR3C5]RJE87595.1 helix-turn-helix transcriptional regulator [Paenibacillus sp. 1011MAR3C5]